MPSTAEMLTATVSTGNPLCSVMNHATLCILLTLPIRCPEATQALHLDITNSFGPSSCCTMQNVSPKTHESMLSMLLCLLLKSCAGVLQPSNFVATLGVKVFGVQLGC